MRTARSVLFRGIAAPPGWPEEDGREMCRRQACSEAATSALVPLFLLELAPGSPALTRGALSQGAGAPSFVANLP